MFEFVNEVIINSAKDSLSGLNKFDNQISGEQGFRVLRVGDYKTANIKGGKIYKPFPPTPAAPSTTRWKRSPWKTEP